MKHNLLKTKTLVFGTFLALIVSAGNLDAQMIAPNNQEVIVYVKESDDKTFDNIKQSLINAGGVTMVGYCGSQQMFYMLVDRNRHADDLFLDGLFRTLNMSFDIKTGATIAQATEACTTGYVAFPADNHSAR